MVGSAVRRRDDEDAATVIAILTALAAAAGGPDDAEPAPPRSAWADPAHRLGVSSASPTGWWVSGLPR
jgi:hypothetical protein